MTRDFPLSPRQAELLAATAGPAPGPMRSACAVEIRGGAVAEAEVRRALLAAVSRHGVLRTTFGERAGEPVQRVHPELAPAWSGLDLGSLPPARANRRLAEGFTAFTAEAPLDLAAGPVLAARWLSRGGDGGELHLVTAAALADLPGLDLLVGEIGRELARGRSSEARGELSPEAAPDLQYGTLAAWQERLLADGEASRAPLPSPLDPTFLDIPEEAPGAASFRPCRRPVPVPAGAVAALADAPGSSAEAVVWAAWATLLWRHGGEESGDERGGEVTVLWPWTGRPFKELGGSVGPFETRLPLTCRPRPGESFAALTRRLGRSLTRRRGEWEDGFPWRHGEGRHGEGRRGEGRRGEGRLGLRLLPPATVHAAGGLSWRRLRALRVDAPLLLSLEASPLHAARGGAPGGWALELVTDGSRVGRARADDLARRLATLIAAAAADPQAPLGALGLLPVEERRRLDLHAAGRGITEPAATVPAATEPVATEPAATVSPEETLIDLFQAQVARDPGAVALSGEGDALTYGELDHRSAALARRLVAAGVGPEAVVGLLLDRSPEMVVAILGVLRAGAAYLPLDPSQPAQRLAFMLADSGATRVLTRGALARRLPQPGPAVLDLDLDLDHDRVDGEGGDEPGAGLPRPPASQLAYVIYTSGSTGKPKGAMVTHANVVRLLRRTEGWFGFGPDDVWTLFHSYAFDFSVWEIWGALAYGGRLVVVPWVVSRSPREFHELLRREGVTVLNQTPSAFAQLVRADATVAGGGELALRWVVFGGEALELGVLAPWFERHGERSPRLVNMYGITETTVHVTYRPLTASSADRGRGRSVGVPIDDLRLHVVDRRGRRRPTGVAGELWVGGAGLARGYLGRPRLTAQRFVPDPWGTRPGARLYRTGDLVRWLGGGDLEYLGRIDHQVKVRGFRIELGEIEAVLADHPSVGAATVLVREDAPGQKRLTAYVAGSAGTSPRAEELRPWLEARLPDYMVPAALVTLDALPLTGNGKVDRRALADLAPPETSGGATYVAPRGPEEEVLAAVWRDVLEVAEVGVHDNFFQLGGDSILSIQVVSRARRGGLKLTPQQLFEHQTVAELAAVAEPLPEAGGVAAAPVTGEAPLTPVQRWFFAQGMPAPHHFNQSLLLLVDAVEPAAVARAAAAVWRRHDALRLRFQAAGEDGRPATHSPPPAVRPALARVDLSALDGARRGAALEAVAARLQASLDLAAGPLLRAALFTAAGASSRLLLVAHHLVVDGVSWRILLEDLALAAASGDQALAAVPTSAPFAAWGRYLEGRAGARALTAEAGFWLDQARRAAAAPGFASQGAPGPVAGVTHREVELGEAETRRLLEVTATAAGDGGVGLDDALLACLCLAAAEVGEAGPGAPLWVEVEGHGREDLGGDPPDVSRTVGWFTSLHPLLLEPDPEEVAAPPAVTRTLARTARLRRSVPHRGTGHGVLRWLAGDDAVGAGLAAAPRPGVAFNNLGRLDGAAASGWRPAPESVGPTRDPRQPASHALTVTARVTGGRLKVDLGNDPRRLDAERVEALAAAYRRRLAAVPEALASRDATPSIPLPRDFPLAPDLEAGELADLARSREAVEDVYPLSPLQQGILFHSLYTADSEDYFEQLSCVIEGRLDRAAFRTAWDRAVARHPVLRTSFHWDRSGPPLQVVETTGSIPVEEVGWSALGDAEVARRWPRLLARDRARGFALDRAPLMRFTLVRLGEVRHRLVWSRHHLLLDGWSRSRLLQEFFADYVAVRGDTPAPLAPPRPFRDYVEWLEGRDRGEALAYWRRLLDGVGGPTPLGYDRVPPAPVDPALAANLETVEEAPHGDTRLRLDPTLSQRVGELARELRVTLNTVMQGAWAILLSRAAGTPDVVFGSVVSGRPPELEGVESMIGLFINNLPVRVRVPGGAALAPWLADLQATQAEQRRFEHTPLAAIQGETSLARGVPLFESMLVFENFPDPLGREGGVETGGLTFSDARFTLSVNVPLAITVAPGERILFQVTHDRERFPTTAVAELLADFAVVLEAMTEAGEAELTHLTAAVDRARGERRRSAERSLADRRLSRLRSVKRRKVKV